MSHVVIWGKSFPGRTDTKHVLKEKAWCVVGKARLVVWSRVS